MLIKYLDSPRSFPLSRSCCLRATARLLTVARCLQTDLLVAAAKTGRVINIKKGQFCAPAVSAHLLWLLLSRRCSGLAGGRAYMVLLFGYVTALWKLLKASLAPMSPL